MPPADDPAPHVTIVIPTHNRAALVRRAIDSALAQTHPNVSVVVVDDGSTDETGRVLATYNVGSRLRVVTHDRNRGVTAAKNSGITNLPPETKWFGILDSDDVLSANAIALLIGGHERPERFSQIIGWCRDARTGLPTGAMPRRSGPVAYEDALCGRFTGEFWHLARRELLGDLRFEERATGGEGALWWLLLRRAPGWLIEDVVRTYDRAGSDRVGIPRYTRAAAIGRMWAYRAVTDAVGDDMRDACPARYALLMAEMAKWAAIGGDKSVARRAARAALRWAPSARTLAIYALAWSPSGVALALGRVASWHRDRRASMAV